MAISVEATAVKTGLPALPEIADPQKIAPKDARAISKLFFDQLQVLEEGTAEYQYARNTLIEMNLSLVQFTANRYRNHGSGQMEDIIQVGTIGLIKAIDRFELSREVEFTTFAIPWIAGEIKRFFRDTTWAVHVPRRLQELRVTLAKAKEEFATTLGREATIAELAAHLEISEEDVTEGLIASNGYTAGSIDLPIEGDRDSDAYQPSRPHLRRHHRQLRSGHGTGREPPRPGPPDGDPGRARACHRADAIRPGNDPGPDRCTPGGFPDARLTHTQPHHHQAPRRPAHPGLSLPP